MTATPILGITEVAPNQNNKETTINDGFLALEQATNAMLAVDLTSADATLVTADFQHYFGFNCSGHTVARNLVVPNQVRLYAVQNLGTGIITVKTTSPTTTTTVPVGAMAIIASDGSNNQKKIADSSVAAWALPLFTGLGDAPTSYTGQAGKLVRVNSGETALEFHQEVMSNLADVATYVPSYFARVKSDGSGIEWVSSAGSSVAEFILMTDAPGSYSGAAGKLLRVNSSATAVEFDAKNAIFALTDLTDCPSSLTGQADKVLAVKADESGMHFVNLPSVGSVITLSTGDPNASFAAGTLSPWSIDIGSSLGNFVTATSPPLSPYVGGFMYSATKTGETQEQISRVWDLTTLATATELDNNSYIQLGYDFAPQNATTTGLVTAQPMSAANVPIGSPFTTGTITGTLNTWGANSLTCALPTGTRKIKIVCQTNSSGTDIAGVWDNLDFTLTVVQDAAFINLSDVPSSYTSQGGKGVRVKSTADGLEFYTRSFIGLSDVPSAFTGNAHLVLRCNAGENALEFYSPSAPTLATLSDVNVTEGSGINGYGLTWDNGTSRWIASPIATVLSALGDVNLTEGSGIDGHLLYWNNGADKWEAKTLAITDLTDVNVTEGAGIDGYVLKWNNSAGKWEASSSGGTMALSGLTDVTVTEGSGIDGYTLNWNNTAGKWEAVAPVSPGATTLHALTDVSVTEGAGIDGFMLYWNNGASKWEAKAPLTAFTGLSDVPSSYTGKGGYAVKVNSGATALEFDYSPAPTIQIAAYQAAVPTTSQLLARYIAAEKFQFPANFATPNSQVRVGTAATGTPVFSVNQNGSQIGTISVSGTTPTLATASGSAKTINAGDYIDIVAPSSADATIADIAFTLLGTKVA